MTLPGTLIAIRDWLIASYHDPVGSNIIAGAVVSLFVLAAGLASKKWRRLRPLTTLRAWARLDAGTKVRWRFRVTETGAIVREQVPEHKGGREVVPPQSPHLSLAMAPDGTVIATVVGRTLRLSTVNPRRGTVHEWKRPIEMPVQLKNSRILAVAPKGEFDVWLAIATDSSEILLCTSEILLSSTDLSRLEPVGWGGKHTYAAFFGARLLFVKERVVNDVKEGVAHEVKERVVHEFVPGGKQSSAWEHRNWRRDVKTVIAVDVAKVGGHTVVAILSKEEDAKAQLFVVTSDQDDECDPFPLESTATHLTVVRDPYANPDEVCVLCGTGHKMRAVYPRSRPVPESMTRQTTARRRWLPRRWRRRANDTVASPGGSS